MDAKKLSEMLLKTLPHHIPVLIQGQPGCGKTAIVTEVTRSLSADMIYLSAALCDPTDAMGMPFVIS